MMFDLQQRLTGNEILWWSLVTLTIGLSTLVLTWLVLHKATLLIAIATTAVFFSLVSLAARNRREHNLTKLAKLLENVLPVDQNNRTRVSSFHRLERSVVLCRDMLHELRHRIPNRHPVTDLETREILLEHIKRASKPGLLCIFELRNFDSLLAQSVEVAEAVLKTLATRAVDMVGRRHVVAQIDRATFAIWLADEDQTKASIEFEALCYAMSGRISGQSFDLLPQIDTGSMRVDEGSAIQPELLSRATSCVRRGGTTSYIVADYEIQRSQYALEQDLRQAIERKQFSMVFQPFIDAHAGIVYGAEALLRWQHPTLGSVSPGTFMPIVEKAGLAEEVGLWVLDTSISCAAKWQHEGLTGVKVAANLSAHQLGRPDIDLVICRMLTRHGLDFGMLELELTETVAALDPASANEIFDRLRSKNISISIDDFGAGYSSLSYLKMLNFDKLKIDREFVTHVDSNGRSQAICQSIIALGRGLGISVLAEGVERYEEYAWLRHHGCRYFQGFHFSKPLDLPAFIAFSNKRDIIHEKTSVGPAALQKKLGVLVA